ncbi:MAG: polysaccharide pyruvyl transferase family protein [Flavobacteriales bacterium]
MKILVIGQCTLHWGRMEFGNIGNYYIIEPFFRELHRAFPGCSIATTFQLSEGFRERERVSVLPMELYYGWTGHDLADAQAELSIAEEFARSGTLRSTTPYIDAVRGSDLIIDFSGDIWGDNADLLGADRFHVGLCKDRTAQLLGKRTAMIAGSPGPFSEGKNLDLARQVFAAFDLVTDREPVSRGVLEHMGFDLSRLQDLACPAFLFEPAQGPAVDALIEQEGLNSDRPIVGFILCGWNFQQGPFDKWPRNDSDYTVFAEVIEHIGSKLGARVCLMSHSNGFPIPPRPFELQHGRDYPVIKQLASVIAARGKAKGVFTLDGVYDAWTTKALIGRFDMLVSGRIHAAVAGLSQHVPTVIIDYGHEPKAHKLLGFATVASVSDLSGGSGGAGGHHREGGPVLATPGCHATAPRGAHAAGAGPGPCELQGPARDHTRLNSHASGDHAALFPAVHRLFPADERGGPLRHL